MRLWKPEIFQGTVNKKQYFEGWYFKLVDKEEKHSFAVIPGISLSPSYSHSFIQFFSGHTGSAEYHTYTRNDFSFSKKEFIASIADSSFSLNHLKLHITSPSQSVKADLRFKNIKSWPVSPFSPGVMGPFRFVPFMECYHGVLSFDHTIEGSITINGETVDMTGGKGYIEKDWGISMPSSWIWMQTNHFDEDAVSLFGSVAKIPWLGHAFPGFIFGLFHKGKTYRFATYTGAKISYLSVTEQHITIHIEDRQLLLKINADREQGADLPAPLNGAMTSKVNESLRSKISVELFDKKNKNVVFSGTGRNAGLEFVGTTSELF